MIAASFRFFGLPPRRYLLSFANSEAPPPLGFFEKRDSSGTSQGLYPGVTSLERASSIDVRANEEGRLKDIILAPERYGSIAIRVNNPSGTEAKDRSFIIRPTTADLYKTTLTKSDGTFEIPVLKPSASRTVIPCS